MAPGRLDEFFVEVMRLLVAHAEHAAPVDLERARRQITVRSLRAQERSAQRLEAAVQDVFVFGRVRPQAELLARIEAVDATQVQTTFARMLETRAAVAIAGQIGRGAEARVRSTIEAR